MLINLSNHPSTKWPQYQIDSAIEKFNGIHDISFPHIDPHDDQKRVIKLVEEYILEIQKLEFSAVHIMGELCFVYRFVQKCKALGIKCIASTTNRLVEEVDGKKVVTFEFVQFREY